MPQHAKSCLLCVSSASPDSQANLATPQPCTPKCLSIAAERRRDTRGEVCSQREDLRRGREVRGGEEWRGFVPIGARSRKKRAGGQTHEDAQVNVSNYNTILCVRHNVKKDQLS